jgi:thiamine biosynthesis lipoprotein
MRRVVIPLDLPPAVPLAVPRDDVVHTLRGETMGTTWSVKLVASQQHWLTPVLGRIERVLESVIEQMSTWVPDSDISRFNASPPDRWSELPPDLYDVLRYALTVSRETEGAFSPTVGALVDLWGFGPPGHRRECPDDASVAAARNGGGLFRLASGRRAFQPGGVRLDLSGIAKGFAVDRVSAELSRCGIAAHLVEIGGELRGDGVKPDGSPWWVALDEPGVQTNSDVIVALHGLAVATSGDTVRYFESGGRRYSHTIDPRTGYPVPGRIAAVTVLHRQCMCADALATALMVLGVDAGFDHAVRHDVAARFVLRGDNGSLERITPALAAMLD